MRTPLPALLLRAALASPFKRPSTHPPARNVLTTTPTTPDPHHLAAYNAVCGYPDRGGTLPLTYPHVLAFPLTMRLMAARDFPLPLLGLVHTSIEITRHRPLPATQELQLSVRTEKLTPHRRGTEATLTIEAASRDGELLWESSSTYLARHRHGTHQRPTETPTPAPAGTHWHLPPDLGRRYASVSGDRNPIHLHPLTARPFGFPHAIAHGMWTIARCTAEHGDGSEVESEGEGATYLKADFKAPVPLPSTVTYTAHGSSAFELRSATGRPHLTGVLTREPSAAPPSDPQAPPTRSS
ncbi:MaoC/PaaZ C-terminal domain-containing protein [Streptomyces sp. NPDC058308]|uniref:MaoC/PaaZ C-terminal domain-containing protein n=1 Tax=Streptomyces sp. NPDC058308 TaxID=3346440 RepID=UPI0036E15DFF